MSSDINHVKIAFELEQDDDGYPPDKIETMWAVAMDQAAFYRLDNIPIYVKGISSEDVIRAGLDGGRLVFEKLEHSSGNSVIRVFVTDVSEVQSARQRFQELGCSSEQSYVPRLFTLEIPRIVSAEPIMTLLEEGIISNKWEYEVGVLRHSTAGDQSLGHEPQL